MLSARFPLSRLAVVDWFSRYALTALHYALFRFRLAVL